MFKFCFTFYIDHFFPTAEQPGSLHSSQGLQIGPVEESWFFSSPEQPQEENERSVQAKLQEEAGYHAFGRFTEKQAKPQPKQKVAHSREEERKRRVSHDPFAQQRPHENVQSTAARGFSDPGPLCHGNAAHQLSGPASQTRMPYWNNGLYNQHGFPPAGTGVLFGSNPNQMYNTFKTPVPETNLPGSTPTIPFISLPLTGKWFLTVSILSFLFPLKMKPPVALSSILSYWWGQRVSYSELSSIYSLPLWNGLPQTTWTLIVFDLWLIMDACGL